MPRLQNHRHDFILSVSVCACETPSHVRITSSLYYILFREQTAVHSFLTGADGSTLLHSSLGTEMAVFKFGGGG